MTEREQIARIIREETDSDHPDQGRYLRAADCIIALPVEAPENGEPDPEWRAIRRAIDQFAGRIPTISKHRAVNNAHIAAVVDRLDSTGDREAADTIVWQTWYRALDRERERFLLADARSSNLATQNAALVEGLTQAADNLAAAAKLYDCPGAHQAELLARRALGDATGEG